MRSSIVLTLCALLGASVVRAGEAPGKADGALKTEEEKTLYTLGALLGRNVAEFSLTPAELKSVQLGLKDAALGKAPQVDLQAYSVKVNLLAQAKRAAKAEGEKTKSKSFLEKAAKEKGAETLASGLVYSEIKPGTGESPKASDKVKVHYHGTLTDGKVFDSSVQRNQPAEFPLNQVIPCWTEGVQKTKVGGKSKLVCPSSIAYGDRGFPPDIPGGATLVFEVELLEILK
ncbi:MAG: FKBP-type peptidyl-prolyl cis-trans isomerase [Elusimicrobiota bacterium]